MKLDGLNGRDLRFMHYAADAALKSECRQRVGAVVVKSGNVVAVTCNKYYNDPSILEEEKLYDHVGICAERRALSMVSDKTAHNSVVYVVRQRRGGDWGFSKPCKRCQKVAKALGVKRMVYVDDNYY